MFTSPKRHALWLPLTLAALAVAWRAAKLGFGVADPIPNFSPWLALAFAGAAVMPRTVPWWSWAALLLSLDLFLNTGHVGEMWTVYLSYALAGLAGGALRGKLGALGVVGGTAAAVIGFYCLTSTQAWWVNPVYAKTLDGWMQAVTVGDPAFQPQAWVFGLRSLIGESLFAVILVAAYNGEALLRKVSGLRWSLWAEPETTPLNG